MRAETLAERQSEAPVVVADAGHDVGAAAGKQWHPPPAPPPEQPHTAHNLTKHCQPVTAPAPGGMLYGVTTWIADGRNGPSSGRARWARMIT